MVRKLEWDSNFFEIAIGELSCEENIDSSIGAFDLIYFKCHADSAIKIDGFEALFNEVKVTYKKTITAGNSQEKCIASFDSSKHDIVAIRELAYESGKQSRFNLDKNFKPQKFREMYDKWVENSINNTFADAILVYHDEGSSMGFATYKIHGESATMGLLAVSPDFQRRGVGQKMLAYVEEKLFKKGITEILIPTQQANIQACNFYEKQGYKASELTYIKHYWKK